MAAQPGITEADLLRQLDDATRGVPDPNALPAAAPQTIKIGDRTVALSDPTAIQQAFEEVQERNRRETEGLRQTVETLQRTYAPPERDTRPPATPPLPNMQPSEWTVEQWADAVRKDPVAAHDQALARALKLPQGMTAAQALQGLAAALTQQTQKLEQLEKNTQQRGVYDDARVFVQTHDDYEPTPQNEQIIFNYCQQLGLGYDAQGLDLAYLKAKADGAIHPKQTQRRTQTEPEPEPMQRGLPSINRQSAATPSEDATLAAYYEKLDKLPADQALQVVKNLYSRQQR